MVEPVLVCVARQMVTSREQPVFADLRSYCWEPGGAHSTVGFPQECAPVVCRDFAPKVVPDFINRLSDLVNRFRLLCMDGGDDVSSLCQVCVSPGLFDQALSQPVLSDMGILVVAGVHFDVSGQALSPGGDSVRAGSRLLVSVDTGDGDQFPLTTALAH